VGVYGKGAASGLFKWAKKEGKDFGTNDANGETLRKNRIKLLWDMGGAKVSAEAFVVPF